MNEESLVLSHYDENSGIAEISFNRGSVLNAINIELAQAFAAAIDGVKKQAGVRCLIIKGKGRAFMAGGDLGDFLDAGDAVPQVVDQLLDALNPVILAIRNFPFPVLAVCQGAVAGAGLSLIGACDLVISTDNCRYMMAYDKVGGPPDCSGSYFIPDLVGERRANELMFLASVWTATQAVDYGLVNRAVAEGELEQLAAQWAETLASGATGAFAAYKSLRIVRSSNSLADQLDAERTAFKSASVSADFKEGVVAFKARRKPNFIGS